VRSETFHTQLADSNASDRLRDSGREYIDTTDEWSVILDGLEPQWKIVRQHDQCANLQESRDLTEYDKALSGNARRYLNSSQNGAHFQS
jgi:hypothetical protein